MYKAQCRAVCSGVLKRKGGQFKPRITNRMKGKREDIIKKNGSLVEEKHMVKLLEGIYANGVGKNLLYFRFQGNDVTSAVKR